MSKKKRKKKRRSQIIDVIRAARKISREAEIKEHTKSDIFKTTVTKSKKIYDRKNMSKPKEEDA